MSSDQDIAMLSVAPSPQPTLMGDEPIGKPEPAPGPRLEDLPPEVMVLVFHTLGMTDRMSLLRTSKTLQGIYNESSTLQYDLALRTAGYLDVPFEYPEVTEDLPEPESIAIAPSANPANDQERGRGRASARSGDSNVPAHPSITFPFRFDPPLSERVHRPSKRPLGAAEKATLLIEREKRWGKLKEVEERRFQIKGPAGVYELQEGIFLMCDSYAESDDRRPTVVRLVPLPSAQDPDLDNPPIPLKSARLPFAIADVTMDPTQDLIVVSEYRPASSNPAQTHGPTHRYHLLTLSSFAPHPLASLSILDFPPYLHPIMSSRQLLQVMGDVLVILVSRFIAAWPIAGVLMGMPLVSSGNEEEVVCWNWKTGRVLSRAALPENGWFASLTVLTPTTFMVTSTSNVSQLMDSEHRGATTASMFPPVIQIYSFAPDPSVSINPSQPLISEFHDDTTPRPILLTQLELPRFAPGASVATFDVRPDPAFPPRVPGANGESSGPRIGGSKPFTQDPSKGVLVFDLQVTEPAEGPEGVENNEMVQYEMFVLRDLFVDLAQRGEERLSVAREEGGQDGFERSKVEESIRWEDWGRDGARLMNASMARRSWVCSCSGYRFISLIPSDDLPTVTPELNDPMNDPPRRSDLRLMDFSPYSVRRQQGLSKPTSALWDKLQDVPTSSAPVPLSDTDIRSLLTDMGSWQESLDDPSSSTERERIFEKTRRQYEKMFHAESARAERKQSDRADRERGRGRAGGTRSDSASQSRSRSRSQHIHGRHHPPSGSHSRTRHHYSPSPGPAPSLFAPEGSGSLRERRSRSRTPRSVSPSAIFRRASQPINMAGPIETLEGEDDIMEDEEDEDYEVRVVLAPTVLERRKVWRNDVISGLPFKEAWRRKEMRANGVMIDDQRVIVVCTEGRRDRQDWDNVRQSMTVLCM